jgi:asparagine synthase (glutamine-hydrolysing)
VCGIVGLAGPQRMEWLSAMNGVIGYRGPDDCGEYRNERGDIGLAMRRLAILDPQCGHQPMALDNGRLWIVYNGEIYNSPGLRADLESRGAKFTTRNSDTEVLLQLYDQKGAAMLEDLNGMFAFVIYDRDRRVLFGARDRIGIKPLYYTQEGRTLAFGSELKCLFTLPWVERRVDAESLFHYASLRFIPGEQSIVEGIKRLPPGCRFEFDIERGELTVSRYWSLEFRPEHGTPSKEWPRRVRHELSQAVARWMLSDVPVGCSLSGGLDSSAIVGLLAEQGHRSLKTYSLGFTGPGEEEWNELPIAASVAKRWATDHHELVLTPDDLLRDLVKMVWHLDEPYGGGLPSWYVFKFMRQDVVVGMTGSGGDELFGDYGRFRSLEPVPGVLGFLKRPQSFRDGYFNKYFYFPDETKREAVLQRSDRDIPDTSGMLQELYESAPRTSVRDAVSRVAFATQLPEEFLLMTDRFSMAHSLEARVPFLDHEFVEFVATIPSDVRTRRDNLKYLLREAIADLLPEEALRARKRGFVIPTGLWLRGALKPLAERLLAPQRLAAQGLYKPDFYRSYVRPHLNGEADYDAQVWTALMFQLWHVLFIEQPSHGEPQFSWKDLC